MYIFEEDKKMYCEIDYNKTRNITWNPETFNVAGGTDN